RIDSWGDQRTLEGFLRHFLRQEYGTFQLASDMGRANTVGTVLRRNY
ncbi:unnamed protein product, partial [Heterosigma akashiwo]